MQSLLTGVGIAALFGFVVLLSKSYGIVDAVQFLDFRVSVIEAVLLGEAGGEGPAGIAAVAEVIRNRMERTGHSAYEVVTQPRQFSCLNGSTPEKIAQRFAGVVNKDAYKYAKILVMEPFSSAIGDTVKGATHYHEQQILPAWADRRKVTATVGRHIFYRL